MTQVVKNHGYAPSMLCDFRVDERGRAWTGLRRGFEAAQAAERFLAIISCKLFVALLTPKTLPILTSAEVVVSRCTSHVNVVMTESSVQHHLGRNCFTPAMSVATEPGQAHPGTIYCFGKNCECSHTHTSVQSSAPE